MSVARAARATYGTAGQLLRRHFDLLVVALVAAAAAMMIVPLPTALVDLLLSLNLALAVILLMAAIYAAEPIRIAAFPTIVLIATVFRLGLNVSTTRLILADADAGQVVRSFGSFVVADSLVVGIVVFLIITIIQFAVVARGSERVAEVAARFALDAMPGKQMAIDADVRNGLIDRSEALRRRSALERESQFYGAMDGAMKFVKGDVVAALVITLINLIGGLVVGIATREMTAAEAAATYSLLSIGDGLAAQLPALLIALSAGLVVTRVASSDRDGQRRREEAHLGHDIASQILAQPRALVVAALFLFALALVPGLPVAPFATVAVITGAVAIGLFYRPGARDRSPDAGDGAVIAVVDTEIATPTAAAIAIDIAEPSRQAEVLPTLSRIRQSVYDDLGVILPPIEIHSDPSLPPRVSRLRIFGMSMVETSDLNPCARQLLSRYASEFLGIQEVQALIDRLAETQPATVREVVPARIDLARLTEVLRRLVSEGIAICDLATVLRAVGQLPSRAKSEPSFPAELTERVRQALRWQITEKFAPGGSLEAWLLDPMVEDELRSAIVPGDAGEFLALEPELSRDIIASIAASTGAASTGRDGPAVLLATADVRRFAAELVRVELPEIAVLSPAELLPSTEVIALGTVGVS